MRCIILLMLTFFISGYSQTKTFRLAHDDYKPYHWLDKNNRSVGIFIDICEEVFKKLGCDVVCTQYPWARAQKEVNEGVDDAYISTPTPIRLKHIVPVEESFVVMDKTLFTYVGHPKIEGLKKIQKLSELKDYKILDYLGNGWAKKTLIDEMGFKIDFAPTVDNVLQKLTARRGDVFIEDPKLVHFNAKMLGLSSKIVELPAVFESTNFNLCVSKKSEFKKEIQKISDVLREIKKDGTFDKILQKWK
ncbi:MAG: transporter substrate-binding domain-containing protein [Chitinispirillia bacterium]